MPRTPAITAKLVGMSTPIAPFTTCACGVPAIPDVFAGHSLAVTTAIVLDATGALLVVCGTDSGAAASVFGAGVQPGGAVIVVWPLS